MAATFSISVDGDDAEAVAAEIASIMGEGAPAGAITRSVRVPANETDAKLVDVVALIGVILAIPGSILAVEDIVDRITKRKKAAQLATAAKQWCREKHVSITMTGPDGTTVSLDQVEADRILEIAGEPGPTA